MESLSGLGRPLRTILVIYSVVISMAIYIIYGDIFPALFGLMVLIGFIRGIHRLFIVSSYALAVYLFGLGNPISMAAATPYPLLTPFIIRLSLDGEPRYTGFLGRSSRLTVALSTIFIPLIVFRPGLTLFYTLQYTWLIILSGYMFVRLRGFKASNIHIPGSMVLNRPTSISLEASYLGRAYYILETNWGYRETGIVAGGHTIELNYTPRNVGSAELSISIYAVDTWLLSSRYVGFYSREVSVAPATLVSIRYILRGLGEVLARAGLPRVVGLVGEGAGAEGLGARGAGALGEGIFGRFLRGLRGVGGEGLAVSRRGIEYIGVREFMMGDRPRDIHWKKSVSRGELFTKIYGGGGGGGGGSGSSYIVIGDLLASSPEELDEVTNKILLALYSQARTGLYGLDTALVLISPFNEVMYARGRLDEVLAFYIELFRRGLIKSLYNYSSFERRLGPEDVYRLFRSGREVRFLRLVSRVSQLLAKKVLNAIEASGYTGAANYTVISGRPGGILNQHIRLLLGLAGYRYLDVSEVLVGVERILAVEVGG